MRYAALLVLLVGCGSIDLSHPDATPPSNEGGTGSAGEAGTDATPPPACNAPVETLNGTATYVKGSVTATSPDAAPIGQPGTCADWVASEKASGFESGFVSQRVVNGIALNGAYQYPTAVVSANLSTGVCTYVLRVMAPAVDTNVEPCALTLDYALAVP